MTKSRLGGGRRRCRARTARRPPARCPRRRPPEPRRGRAQGGPAHRGSHRKLWIRGGRRKKRRKMRREEKKERGTAARRPSAADPRPGGPTAAPSRRAAPPARAGLEAPPRPDLVLGSELEPRRLQQLVRSHMGMDRVPVETRARLHPLHAELLVQRPVNVLELVDRADPPVPLPPHAGGVGGGARATAAGFGELLAPNIIRGYVRVRSGAWRLSGIARSSRVICVAL